MVLIFQKTLTQLWKFSAMQTSAVKCNYSWSQNSSILEKSNSEWVSVFPHVSFPQLGEFIQLENLLHSASFQTVDFRTFGWKTISNLDWTQSHSAFTTNEFREDEFSFWFRGKIWLMQIATQTLQETYTLMKPKSILSLFQTTRRLWVWTDICQTIKMLRTLWKFCVYYRHSTCSSIF